MKILHAASECFPLAKTGGLGDVVSALPAALRKLGIDARVCLPAYRGVAQKLTDVRVAGEALDINGLHFDVLSGQHAASGLRLLLLDCPPLFDRGGDPYHDENGKPWPDNAWRFGCYSEAVARVAEGCEGWRADIVHLHDWQVGLAAPRLAMLGTRRPMIVFTIHNLAYQGVFGREEYAELHLPQVWWHMDGLEFWGGFSFIKGGLNYSDAITTVSPTYAREILTPDHGHGLDGVLRYRSRKLVGIANGIDADAWNPATDPYLDRHYNARSVVAGKKANKAAVLSELGLEASGAPLLIYIGRFAQQKGADLLLEAAEALMKEPLQIAVLGSGDRKLEQAFAAWAARESGRVAVCLRHDERLAHRMTAAADLQLMPSRFEPCGLNQMYAQRYGTIPVVRNTGGLADTVVDTTAETMAAGTATGVLYQPADSTGVIYGVGRGLELLAQQPIRLALQRAGMKRDFSWKHSAREYLDLYHSLLKH